jgi:hypothetical protein
MGRPLYGEKGFHRAHSGFGVLRETPARWRIAYIRNQRFLVRHSAQHQICRCRPSRWLLSGLDWVLLESQPRIDNQRRLSDRRPVGRSPPSISPACLGIYGCDSKFFSHRGPEIPLMAETCPRLPKYSDPRNLVPSIDLPHTRLTYHRTWETGLGAEIRVAVFSPAFFCPSEPYD